MYSPPVNPLGPHSLFYSVVIRAVNLVAVTGFAHKVDIVLTIFHTVGRAILLLIKRVGSSVGNAPVKFNSVLGLSVAKNSEEKYLWILEER